MTIMLNPDCNSCNCPGTNAPPYLYCGGAFSDVYGFDSSGSPTSFACNIGSGFATSMLKVNSDLYVGGFIGTINGANRNGIGSVDALTGAVNPFDIQLDGLQGASTSFVAAILLHTNLLYIGGSFQSACGIFVETFAGNGNAVNVDLSGAFAGWTPYCLASGVQALTGVGSTIYIGGAGLGRVGTTSVRGVASVDDGGGAIAGWYPGDVIHNDVYAMETDGSTVWFGGDFFEINGVPINSFAATDAFSGSVLGTSLGLAVDDVVLALKYLNGVLYIGGQFTSSYGRHNAMAIDTLTGSVTSWAPEPNGAVHGIDVCTGCGKVALAGQFTSVGGGPQAYCAIVDTAGTLVPTFAPSLPARANSVLFA